MRRRQFVTFAMGAILVSPLDLRAQQAAKIWRIGFLAHRYEKFYDSLFTGLRELGYVEGQNLIVERRFAEGNAERFKEFAAEMVRLNVDAIIVVTTPAAMAAKNETKTIPIVHPAAIDPVGTGLIASLAHPGGNVTGVSMVLTELAAKGLEILKEAVPSIMRVGVLWNPTTPSHLQVVNQLKIAATSLGLQLIMTPVRETADLSDAFAVMRQEHVDGFIVPPSPLTNSQVAPLAELELRHRLPGMFGNKDNVRAGGLMSYGADFDYMYRHAATYIGKVLQGEKPADLPVEQASKYYLILNLKTAKALGTELSPTVIARADEVIE